MNEKVNEKVNEFEITGVDIIPEESKIFTQEHNDYVRVLAANILLNDTKGQLLNIIEGIGLSEKRERAIKRSVTNLLHETVHHFEDCMDMVTEVNTEVNMDIKVNMEDL